MLIKLQSARAKSIKPIQSYYLYGILSHLCIQSTFIVLHDITMMVDLGFFLNFRLKSKPWMVAIGDNGIEYNETGGIRPRGFPDNSQIVLYILPFR